VRGGKADMILTRPAVGFGERAGAAKQPEDGPGGPRRVLPPASSHPIAAAPIALEKREEAGAAPEIA
jgi:hypothetical protein